VHISRVFVTAHDGQKWSEDEAKQLRRITFVGYLLSYCNGDVLPC
jgi:hypothetical protein